MEHTYSEVLAPGATCSALPPTPSDWLTELEYDAAGRLQYRREKVDGQVRETEFDYDDAGRRRLVHQPALTTGGPRGTQETRYDPATGQVWKVGPLNGPYTEYGYDGAGRKVEERYRTAANSLIAQKAFEYDTLGRLTREIDENGHPTDFGHDALGRLSWVRDAEGRETHYGHDIFGNLESQLDARENTTLYEHDLMGRRTAKVLPLGQREETTYTVSGQVKQHWPFGSELGNEAAATSHAYEPGTDRLASTSYPASGGLAGLTTSYGYEDDGSLATVSRDDGAATQVVTRRYDDEGRVKDLIRPDGSWLRNSHDELGFRRSVSVFDGDPDAGGNLLHQLDFTSDARGRLASVVFSPPGGTVRSAHYTYDDATGLLESIRYATGPTPTVPPDLYVVQTWDTADPRPRLLKVEWFDGAATKLLGLEYHLDAAGHRLGITQTGELGYRSIWYNGSTCDPLAPMPDATYRLTHEDHYDSAACDNLVFTARYSYDAVGNRTQVAGTNGTLDYSHDANDRILAEGPTSFAWDDRGRLASSDDGTGPIDYTWSQDDRLLSVVGPTIDVSYAYDPEQRLVARTAGGATTGFVVDPGFPYAQALLEYVGSPVAADVTARHVFGHRLLGEEQDGTLRWTLTDALGSVRGLYEPGAGTLDGPWTYEGFGPEVQSNAAALTHRFAGERGDGDTGLDYLRARWMRPGWGAFVSRDPFEGLKQDPITRHPVVALRADPLGTLDPSGEVGVAAVSAGLLIQGAGLLVGLPPPPSLWRSSSTNDARAQAWGDASQSLAMLLADIAFDAARNAVDKASSKYRPCFERWFGASAGNPLVDGLHLDVLENLWLAKQGLREDFRYVSGDRGRKSILSAPAPWKFPHAQSWRDGVNLIRLYDAFFALPELGQRPFRTRAGVLLHEALHEFGEHTGGSDSAYGEANAERLANMAPASARGNADNYRLFAEQIYWEFGP